MDKAKKKVINMTNPKRLKVPSSIASRRTRGEIIIKNNESEDNNELKALLEVLPSKKKRNAVSTSPAI